MDDRPPPALILLGILVHVAALTWLLVRAEPGEDLEVFRHAARVVADGVSPYGPRDGPPYIYTPLFAYLAGPVLRLGQGAWLLLGEVAFLASVALLRRQTPWAFVLLALLPAVYDDLAYGQVNLLLLATLLGAHQAQQAERPALAAALVVLGCLTKPLPLLLLPLWALQRRWRAVAWSLAACAATAAVTAWAFPELSSEYLAILLGLPQGDYGIRLPLAGFANHSAPNALALVAGDMPRALTIGLADALVISLLLPALARVRDEPWTGLATVGLLGVL